MSTDMAGVTVGDVLWYRTGQFSASRVEVLSISGAGGARSFQVRFIDHAPSQTDGSEWNQQFYPLGGISIAARKCERIDEEE